MAEEASEAAVLFADVSGSTKLYESAGNAVAHAAVESCVNLMKQKTQAAKGRVIKTIGDEVMCILPDADSGHLAATDMELSLRASLDAEVDGEGYLHSKRVPLEEIDFEALTAAAYHALASSGVEVAVVEAGERCLLLAFEESRDQLFRNAEAWGMDFARLEKEDPEDIHMIDGSGERIGD